MPECVSGMPVLVVGLGGGVSGACKRLAPEVAGSKGILELSKQFVMINCEDDEEPMHEKFKPVRCALLLVCVCMCVRARTES